MNIHKEKITLAIITRDGLLHTGCVRGLIESAGIWDEFLTVEDDSVIPRARDRAAALFLAGKTDRIVFVDDDIFFHRKDLDTLLSGEQTVVGGIYPFRSDEGKWVFVQHQPGEVRVGGPVAVKRIGAGFLAIKRHAFELLRCAHGEKRCYKRNGDKLYQYFRMQVNPADNEYLSEDYAFCDDCWSAGLAVFADTRIRLQHRGWKTYSGKLNHD